MDFATADGSATAGLDYAPTNGTLTLSTNGGFIYMPNSNYFGSDSFTYRANDGSSNSAPATVTITVNANLNRLSLPRMRVKMVVYGQYVNAEHGT